MTTYICHTSELREDKCNAFTVAGKKISVIKTAKGIFAIDNKCPHMGLPLSVAKVEGQEVECRFHRARFDIETGNVIKWASFPPVIVNALNAIRKEKKLVTYPVVIEDEKVYLK